MKSCRSLIRVGAIAVGVTAGAWAAEIDRGATLYDRLGGMPAIRAVVDDLMVRILGDPRISPWFGRAAADPERAAAYKANLADLVCQATGGPCKYTSLDMVTAHKGRGVTLEGFNSMVDDVEASLDKLKVPSKEKQELLGILAPLKAAIVQQ